MKSKRSRNKQDNVLVLKETHSPWEDSTGKLNLKQQATKNGPVSCADGGSVGLRRVNALCPKGAGFRKEVQLVLGFPMARWMGHYVEGVGATKPGKCRDAVRHKVGSRLQRLCCQRDRRRELGTNQQCTRTNSGGGFSLSRERL